VSQKTCHSTSVHNFDKCSPIIKILSLSESARNLQQHVALHYLAKFKYSHIIIFDYSGH